MGDAEGDYFSKVSGLYKLGSVNVVNQKEDTTAGKLFTCIISFSNCSEKFTAHSMKSESDAVMLAKKLLQNYLIRLNYSRKIAVFRQQNAHAVEDSLNYARCCTTQIVNNAANLTEMVHALVHENAELRDSITTLQVQQQHYLQIIRNLSRGNNLK